MTRGKNEGKSLFDVSCFILPPYEADITHTSWQMHVAIKAHSKMKCTNIQGHKNKLRTWEKSVTHACEPECSAAQQLERTAKHPKVAAMENTCTDNEEGNKGALGAGQQRKAAATTGSTDKGTRRGRGGAIHSPRASRQHKNEQKTAVCMSHTEESCSIYTLVARSVPLGSVSCTEADHVC